MYIYVRIERKRYGEIDREFEGKIETLRREIKGKIENFGKDKKKEKKK